MNDERKLTHEEAKATHPSRTGSPAESMRLRDEILAGHMHVVDGKVVAKTEDPL